MADFNFVNGLRIPIIVLGYSPRKLFSVSDIHGKVMVPVFSNAEYARSYQKYFNEGHSMNLLTFILEKYEKAIDLFSTIKTADPLVTSVIIDPMPPTAPNLDEKVITYDIQEYTDKLRNCKARIRDKKNNY